MSEAEEIQRLREENARLRSQIFISEKERAEAIDKLTDTQWELQSTRELLKAADFLGGSEDREHRANLGW